MTFENTQRAERAQELEYAIRQQVERRLEDRLRKMVTDKIQAWYDKNIDHYADQLEREADRIFAMILEGKSSGRAIEDEPRHVAKRFVAEMNLQ